MFPSWLLHDRTRDRIQVHFEWIGSRTDHSRANKMFKFSPFKTKMIVFAISHEWVKVNMNRRLSALALASHPHSGSASFRCGANTTSP